VWKAPTGCAGMAKASVSARRRDLEDRS
jgi:hypothetical protein